jgi:hypothetical protein
MTEIFGPNADFAQLVKEYPERFSVTNAVKSAHEAGLKPCIGIIQNVLDTHHYGKHFVPFCGSVGISPIGGTDDTGFIASCAEAIMEGS